MATIGVVRVAPASTFKPASDTITSTGINQLLRHPREEVEVAVGQPEFEDDVAPLDIAEVAQPLSKRVEYRRLIAVRGCEDADAGELHRLLRARRERPGPRHARSEECRRA